METRDRVSGQGLDWSGSLTATSALALLTWSLTAAAEPQSSVPSLLVPLVAAALFFGMFVIIEQAKGERALVPPLMFATSSFTGLTLLTLLLYTSLSGLTVVLPFFLIRFAGYSASAAGAALLPIPIIIGLGSRLVALVTHSVGPRRLLACGSLIVATGFLLYATVPADGIDYWRHVMPATLLVAIGMALCVAPLTTAVMDSVDSVHIGAASGINSATARVGGLVASALLAFVFVRQGSNQQLFEAFRTATTIGAVICAVAAASTVLLVRQPDAATRL